MAKKAETFFIPADEAKADDKKLTIDQKIKEFSIKNRARFMELQDAVGVTTTKGKNVTAIVYVILLHVLIYLFYFCTCLYIYIIIYII